MDISDKESLKKENITLDNSINEFNEVTQGIIVLKNIIENEIEKINNLYEKVNNDLIRSFQKKHEKLVKKENDLRERLQNEVTKAKEKLENYLYQSSNTIKMNEKINTKIKKFINKERNILKDLAYMSKLNKTIEESKKLFQEPMKAIKFYYKKEEENIIYEKYVFNELPLLKNDEIDIIFTPKLSPFLNSPIKEDKDRFIERLFSDDLEGEYDDEGFFNTPNGSFWDPDGVYFNREGFDKHGGYYDDNIEYIPGKGWIEEYNCYKDEIKNSEEDEFDFDDCEEDSYGFNDVNIDSILDEEQFIKIPSNLNNSSNYKSKYFIKKKYIFE